MPPLLHSTLKVLHSFAQTTSLRKTPSALLMEDRAVRKSHECSAQYGEKMEAPLDISGRYICHLRRRPLSHSYAKIVNAAESHGPTLNFICLGWLEWFGSNSTFSDRGVTYTSRQ